MRPEGSRYRTKEPPRTDKSLPRNGSYTQILENHTQNLLGIHSFIADLCIGSQRPRRSTPRTVGEELSYTNLSLRCVKKRLRRPSRLRLYTPGWNSVYGRGHPTRPNGKGVYENKQGVRGCRNLVRRGDHPFRIGRKPTSATRTANISWGGPQPGA